VSLALARAALALLLLWGRCDDRHRLSAAEQVEDSSALTLPNPVPARGDPLPVWEPPEPPRCTPEAAVALLFSILSPSPAPARCP